MPHCIVDRPKNHPNSPGQKSRPHFGESKLPQESAALGYLSQRPSESRARIVNGVTTLLDRNSETPLVSTNARMTPGVLARMA
jgi:hypothetical protein